MRKKIIVISELLPPKSGGAGRGIHDYLIRNKNNFDFSIVTSVSSSEYMSNINRLHRFHYVPTYRHKNSIISILLLVKTIFYSIKTIKTIKNCECIFIASPSIYSLIFSIFAKILFSHGRNTSHEAPSVQIRTCGIAAYGSYLG